MNKILLKIIPLGGVGEIGKNLTVFETEKEILLVDCGVAFPSEEMPGVDVLVPDVSYLIDKVDKIKGIIITHGHEDHVGGVPYLLAKLNSSIPVYATDFTLSILDRKMREAGLSTRTHSIHANSKRAIGSDFSVEFIHVNHSIPGAVALAIKTPAGVIIHTGDFKIDLTPTACDVIDLTRFGEYGKKGVRMLLMDSTNVEREGYSQSERTVEKTLEGIFAKHKSSRIIVSTFSSNIYRIQKIIKLAEEQGRKVAITGRSMENSIAAAITAGITSFSPKTIISIDETKAYEPNKTVIITTGAQGEVAAALNRIASGTFGKLSIEPGDVIAISSHPIPGNEKAVNDIINKLYQLGAIVYSDKNAKIHASGHAYDEEQKMILALTKPEYFMPVHGEPLHLRASKQNAMKMGLKKENIIVAPNGRQVLFTKDAVVRGKSVRSGEIIYDRDSGCELNPAVIKDRQVLMNDGVVVLSCVIDRISRKLESPMLANSRGFVYMNDSLALMQSIQRTAEIEIVNLLADSSLTLGEVKVGLSRRISKYITQKTNKSPIVLVVINQFDFGNAKKTVNQFNFENTEKADEKPVIWDDRDFIPLKIPLKETSSIPVPLEILLKKPEAD